MVSPKTERVIYKKYNEKVKNFRSEIIENATTLEIQLEWIISSFFSKNFDDYALFNYLFFGENVQLGFHDKILMFEKLLEVNMKEFQKKHPDIIMKLNRIRKVRNRFAHGEATSPHINKLKYMKKQIFFEIVEKGEKKDVDYTFVFLKEILKDFDVLNKILADEIRRLKMKHSIFSSQLLSDMEKYS